jgi:hypothetical protein
MAETFDGAQYPDIKRITLSGTPDNATEVVIPASAKTATIRFETNAGKLAFNGTDAAAIDSGYIVVTADATHQFSLTDGIAVSKGVGSFFIASGTASTVCSVMLEG